jgi:hypothetical protein
MVIPPDACLAGALAEAAELVAVADVTAEAVLVLPVATALVAVELAVCAVVVATVAEALDEPLLAVPALPHAASNGAARKPAGNSLSR